MPSTIFENYTIYSETMNENTYVRNNHIAAICETFSIIILRSVLPFKITTISIRTLSTEKASFRRNTALKKTENYSILNSEWLGYSTDKR